MKAAIQFDYSSVVIPLALKLKGKLQIYQCVTGEVIKMYKLPLS